jgi:hypothetical protein
MAVLVSRLGVVMVAVRAMDVGLLSHAGVTRE